MEVPNNMDALDWLRKHLDEDGSDLLREMVQRLRRAPDVRRGRGDLQCRLRRGHPGSAQQPQRLSGSGLRHPGRHHRARHPQAPPRQLPPDLAARAAAAGRAGADPGGGRVLRARGLDPARRRPGPDPRHRAPLQVPGLRHGQRPGQRGRGLPEQAPRRRALHLRLARRHGAEGARGRPHPKRGRRHRDGCECRGAPRGARLRRDHHRGRGGLGGLLAWPGRPGAQRHRPGGL